MQTPSMNLAGKRAVITGAGRGIGAAAARALSAAGAEVHLLARTSSEIDRLALQLGTTATAFVLDVTDRCATQRYFAEQPAPDILVNNAGINRPKAFLEVTEEDLGAVIELNLTSAFMVAQGAAQRMVEDGVRGSLIHMSSQMGHVGGENRSIYCATKWGIEGLSKSIALDLAQYGIRSNTIAPTFIETPMTAPFFADPQFRKEVLAKISLGRLGKPEDIMGAVLFLASDASSMMTGSSMVIDGGWTAA